MRSDTGSVPIGTFHAREGDGPIELWSGVDDRRLPDDDGHRSRRREPAPSRPAIVVLRGEIPEP